MRSATHTGRTWCTGREAGNVMYEAENDVVKVTISESPDYRFSRPKPEWCSVRRLHVPEQLQGKKSTAERSVLAGGHPVSARCGKLPFEGIDGATHVQDCQRACAGHPAVQPVPPPALVAFLDKRCQGSGERYQTGEEFAAHCERLSGSFRYGDRRRVTSACELRRSMMTLSGALEIASCTDPGMVSPQRDSIASDGTGLVVLATAWEDTTQARWQAAWPHGDHYELQQLLEKKARTRSTRTAASWCAPADARTDRKATRRSTRRSEQPSMRGWDDADRRPVLRQQDDRRAHRDSRMYRLRGDELRQVTKDTRFSRSRSTARYHAAAGEAVAEQESGYARARYRSDRGSGDPRLRYAPETFICSVRRPL